MIRRLAALVLAAGFLSSGGSVSAGTMQQRLERVCAGAIDRLCAEARPDGGRINACLASHRAELLPDCARLVDIAD
jgi:hypothetical protein